MHFFVTSLLNVTKKEASCAFCSSVNSGKVVASSPAARRPRRVETTSQLGLDSRSGTAKTESMSATNSFQFTKGTPSPSTSSKEEYSAAS
jgi:hypothetical protein